MRDRISAFFAVYGSYVKRGEFDDQAPIRADFLPGVAGDFVHPLDRTWEYPAARGRNCINEAQNRTSLLRSLS